MCTPTAPASAAALTTHPAIWHDRLGVRDLCTYQLKARYQLGLTWHVIRNVQEECATLCQLANPLPDTLPCIHSRSLAKERIKMIFPFFNKIIDI